MNLYKDVWIEGGYYIDFDQLGQLRIIGPNNHLYCGLVDVPRHQISIRDIQAREDDSLQVSGRLNARTMRLYYPMMADIRSLRKAMKTTPQYLSLRRQFPGDFIPHEIKVKTRGGQTQVLFRREYENHFYQSIFLFPRGVKVKPISHPLKGFELSSPNRDIAFSILLDTDDLPTVKLPELFLTRPIDFDWRVFGRLAPLVKRELKLTEREIFHLLEWHKTSGDRFGTVFPRDWMESADIGLHDLTAIARMHMYRESLRHVNDKGEGWHEDVVGELRARYAISGLDINDRHMIDIEPHYLMGLEKLPDDFLVEKDVLEKIRRVAKYFLGIARKRQPVLFKKKPGGGYYDSGNWRDSGWAYKRVSPLIAPFDVNAVFYPKALKVLHDKEELLNFPTKDLHQLMNDWMQVKEKYRFKNRDGRTAFALTLSDASGTWQRLGRKTKKMAVNHLDESYYFTYLDGTAEEVRSFVDRLLDPDYFYTPSGPLLIAKNNTFGYTPEEYHGEVIWTKQVAYVVLGLSKHLKTAIIQDWPLPLKKKIKQAIVTTCENMIKVYDRLGYVPEVHKDVLGRPEIPEDPGGVSRVQLWSAVGVRRIFRKYHDLKTDLRYKFDRR